MSSANNTSGAGNTSSADNTSSGDRRNGTGPFPLAVEVCRLSRRFDGGVQALESVSLEVAAGEFLAVLGPSGCGKSTLLRLIAGLDQPTSGTVHVFGETPDQVRRRRELGIVFQDPALFPWRTVSQNVRLPGEISRSPEVLERVNDWINRVGLTGFEDALPAQLSGGMRSRVAIARALVSRPRMLMMDEPFGALDELTRLEMQRELLTLWQETGATTIFITHSIAEALFLADRVVVMTPRPGRIRAVIESPFPRPRHPRLRGLPEFARMTDELFELLSAPARD